MARGKSSRVISLACSTVATGWSTYPSKNAGGWRHLPVGREQEDAGLATCAGSSTKETGGSVAGASKGRVKKKRVP